MTVSSWRIITDSQLRGDYVTALNSQVHDVLASDDLLHDTRK